ncbi:MAG: TonB-linked SusC/RagA family outer membrane protein [Cyclobacteriaceae bacterium]|jgi:TonB-linked SusC/RagA family outer membrane protein
MRRYLTQIIFLFVILTNLNAQNSSIQLTGVVKDSNGEPLPGATIQEVGANNGTVTDVNGNYQIMVNPEANLIASFVGFESKTAKVGGRSLINFVLPDDIHALEEIVVVGYGSQKKSDLTGSVASIDVNRIDAKPNTNFSQALQGALPGVNITLNSSSAEQNDVSILIRGRNSINASNSPLIVLDGVPYAGSISDINTSDIKNMTVLKDASATAIYGSRGANGVILIQTKEGTKGQPKITYSGYIGISDIGNVPAVYDGPGFAAFKETREPGELTPSELDLLAQGKGTDWLSLATQTGVKQEHNLSVSGATDNAKYYVSMGYLDAQGVAINDNFNRVSLRVNLSFDITKDLKFGTSTQLSRIDRSGLDPDFGGEAAGAYFLNPLSSAYDSDGSPTIFPWPEDQFFENALAPTLAVNDDINNKIFTTNYLMYSFPFLEGLSYKINTGIEVGARKIGTYWGRNTARGFTSGGDAQVSNQSDENFLLENILNYSATFGKHSIGFTGLYSAQKIKSEDNGVDAVGFPSDLLTYYQNHLAVGISPSSSFTQTTLLSQMARVNYGYADKYMVTMTVRRDGFSGFGDENKYGIFPSVAVGWNIGDEAFFPTSFVSKAKFRISYGENGNQAVGPYDNLARLSDRSYLNGSQTAPGFVPNQLANNELSWEKTATLNFGLDLGLISDRVQFSADIYRASTSDLLLDRLIPSVHGITEITQNIGKVQNEGIELSTSGFAINKKDFTWNIAGNMSFNRNEIVSLFGKNQDDIGNGLFIGKPIRSNYSLVFDGIWQEGEDATESAQPNAHPGDVKVKDIDNPIDTDGNPVLGISSEHDRAIQGQRDPKTTWGLTNTLKYKGFSLYVFIHGVEGVTKRNTIYDENVYGGVKRNWFVLDYWTQEDPIKTFHRNHPQANIYNVGFYQSADFMRVKDITLSYTFNDSLLGKTGISGLRVYTTLRNLITITDWTGLDPELSSQRSVPLQKEIVFGLNFSL